MHRNILFILPALAMLWLAPPLLAQEAARPSLEQKVEELRRQMEDGRKAFEAQMKEMREKLADLAKPVAPGTGETKPLPPQDVENFRRQMEERQKAFDAWMKEMQRKLDELAKSQAQEESPNDAAIRKAVERIMAEEERKKSSPQTEAQLGVTPEQMQELNEKVDRVAEAQKKTLMSEFNPSIGLVGETIFSYHRRRSDESGSDRPGGFDVFQRSVELNAAASVDPFAKAYVVANAQADPVTGESTLGIEEAALQTTSLPWNLELKAGRFFGEFGRLSYIHDHELPFVNRPLVLAQYIGGESRTDGLQVNWLLPTSHYISWTAGVGNNFGGDSPNPDNPGAYRGFTGLNFWSRLSTYFDLTPNWQLETGVSGLWNPTTEDRGGAIVQSNGVSTLTEKERRLAGVDWKVSYVPLRDNQFNRITWGTEVLYSDNHYLSDPDGVAASGDEHNKSIGSTGMYSYLEWKWHRQWSTGFLFDFVENQQDKHDRTCQYSPYITWAISHWNQLRLQYTHTEHAGTSPFHADDAVMLQWAWIIGSHSHGWQQR